MPRKYAIIFAKNMQFPMYIVCNDMMEFFRKLQNAIMDHGDVELVYRVY